MVAGQLGSSGGSGGSGGSNFGGGGHVTTTIPKQGSQQEIRKQPSRPNEVKVDTTSILASGITPSAVHKGVNRGDDVISKYRINSNESTTENIDWNKTIKNASRAAVDEPDEVWAQKSHEPKVNVSNPSLNRPANTGPLPSEQIRKDPEAFRSTPPAMTSPISRPPPSQPVTSPKSGNLPPPPGPSRTVYTPPPQPSNPYRSTGVTVAESNVRPSILKDNSDPLERFRIKDPPVEQSTSDTPIHSSQKGTEDPLDKYRVKSPEEEEMSLNFYLTGLITEPGKPVELKCNGQLIFTSEGINGVVNSRTSFVGSGEVTDAALTIKALPYTLNKTLEHSKGRFVRFALEKGALKFRQQKTED